jgi:6-pyruvoyltetrahydropterin/6-carboxytetrahydropterin synthase
MSLYRTVKTFDHYPCSHRQWRHAGHCKYIHGYSRSFTITFGCHALSDSGFGVDFGELKDIKAWLSHWFDHTTLINADDPEMALFESMHAKEIIDLRVLPNVSMERTAEFVFDYVDDWIQTHTDGRAFVLEVECRENSKNAGIYRPPRVS